MSGNVPNEGAPCTDSAQCYGLGAYCSFGLCVVPDQYHSSSLTSAFGLFSNRLVPQAETIGIELGFEPEEGTTIVIIGVDVQVLPPPNSCTAPFEFWNDTLPWSGRNEYPGLPVLTLCGEGLQYWLNSTIPDTLVDNDEAGIVRRYAEHWLTLVKETYTGIFNLNDGYTVPPSDYNEVTRVALEYLRDNCPPFTSEIDFDIGELDAILARLARTTDKYLCIHYQNGTYVPPNSGVDEAAEYAKYRGIRNAVLEEQPSCAPSPAAYFLMDMVGLFILGLILTE
jgi:hypothetical protein